MQPSLDCTVLWDYLSILSVSFPLSPSPSPLLPPPSPSPSLSLSPPSLPPSHPSSPTVQPTEYYDDRNAVEERLGQVSMDDLASEGLLLIRVISEQGKYGFIVKVRWGCGLYTVLLAH